MPVTVVVGSQWGDEGKGKLADHLAERASMVVRYQGGNNAGHTVVIGDTTLKLHQVPAGITRPEVAAVLGHGMVINPPALVEELETLDNKGIPIENMYISCNAHMIMPYHLLFDGLEEKLRGNQAIGTTRRGIGPAYTDKVARRGLRMQDLCDMDRFARKVDEVLKRVNLEITRLFEEEPLTVEEIVEAYRPAAERLAPFITDTTVLINEALTRDEKVLMEGAQGTMLDIDFGTYPYVTSSSPTSGGACQGAGINPMQIQSIVGVVKAYTSRVGEGPFPTELMGEMGDWIRDRGYEYGTTTGRPRRCGWLDLVCLGYAARVNGFTGLALTKLDVLSGLDEIKFCTAYRLPDGTELETYPLDSDVLAQAEPVYESVPGWDEDISAVRTFDDLPTNAKGYCRRVSELLKIPIDLISVGAERQDLVVLHWPI